MPNEAYDWTSELETNNFGRRILTLEAARRFASAGASRGWYVAPFALGWTIGRRAEDGESYHVLSDGEPIHFRSEVSAAVFLQWMTHGRANPCRYDPFARRPNGARADASCHAR